MPSLVAEQVRPDATLVSPLAEDAAITMQWSVHDEHTRPMLRQTCTLTLAAGRILTANVPTTDRKYTFRLTKGMQVTLPIGAQITVNLDAQGPNPAPQAETLNSNQLEIRSRSKNDVDGEAAKTVYGELNQELRRTRTLYETFLVVVTGALATVFSKRSDIAGAYRPSFAYGLGFLALIVIYMIWQIAQRYRNATSAIFNLERSWGLRSTQPPEYPLDSPSSWKSWLVDHAWRHTVWAIGLMFYALLAIGIVINFLRAPAEPAKPATQPVSMVCSCPTPGQTPGENQRSMPSGGVSSRQPQSPAGRAKKK